MEGRGKFGRSGQNTASCPLNMAFKRREGQSTAPSRRDMAIETIKAQQIARSEKLLSALLCREMAMATVKHA